MTWFDIGIRMFASSLIVCMVVGFAWFVLVDLQKWNFEPHRRSLRKRFVVGSLATITWSAFFLMLIGSTLAIWAQ